MKVVITHTDSVCCVSDLKVGDIYIREGHRLGEWETPGMFILTDKLHHTPGCVVSVDLNTGRAYGHKNALRVTKVKDPTFTCKVGD